MFMWYISQCMVSIINIINGSKEPIIGFQIQYTNKTYDIWWVRQVESFWIHEFIFWSNTILIHIDTKVILPKYEKSCMVYRCKWNKIKIK